VTTPPPEVKEAVMKTSKFTEEQKVAALKLAESSSVDEVCRKIGISRNTFYLWKKKLGGMNAGDAKRLKELEDENRRLKKLLAEEMLSSQIVKELLAKK